MFCIRCQRDVYYCICPDIEERLKAISEHKNWAIEWCTTCDNAKDRCTCPDVPAPAEEPRNPVFRSWGRFISWA